MRPGGTLTTVLAIAGTPVAVLIVLLATGEVSARGAVIAIGLTLLVALGLALLWIRDLDVLSETVRRLGELQPISETPALPGVERLGREIERLSRRLAERAAVMERLLRADEAIVERLPDPLIVLAADRSVRRANSAARAAFGADMPAVLRHPLLRAAIDRAFEGPRKARSRPRKSACRRRSRGSCTRRWCRWIRRWPMAGAPSWCCRIARGSMRWSGCVPTSSPTPATSCARRWPR